MAPAARDDAINRDDLASAHQDLVADGDRFDRDILDGSFAHPVRNCGARSTSALRSRSARATAIVLEHVAAGIHDRNDNGGQRSRRSKAALIDTSATASTPTRPAKSERVIEIAKATTTGSVASDQAQ